MQEKRKIEGVLLMLQSLGCCYALSWIISAHKYASHVIAKQEKVRKRERIFIKTGNSCITLIYPQILDKVYTS